MFSVQTPSLLQVSDSAPQYCCLFTLVWIVFSGVYMKLFPALAKIAEFNKSSISHRDAVLNAFEAFSYVVATLKTFFI